jgi:hypothetical protein
MTFYSVDPSTSITAAYIISLFLSSVGDGFAKKAGERLLEKAGEVYSSVKDVFSEGEFGHMTLLNLSDTPENEALLTVMSDELFKKMESDDKFAQLLTKLVEEAKEADTDGLLIKGDRNVTIGGSVSSTVINTGDIHTFQKDK